MNRIKEVLEEKGIKQTWLAEKIGKSFSQTNAYVCNRRQPSLEQLFEIAKILSVDVKELIDDKEKNVIEWNNAGGIGVLFTDADVSDNLTSVKSLEFLKKIK